MDHYIGSSAAKKLEDKLNSDIYLKLKPKEWSGPGACGLCCVGMAIEYFSGEKYSDESLAKILLDEFNYTGEFNDLNPKYYQFMYKTPFELETLANILTNKKMIEDNNCILRDFSDLEKARLMLNHAHDKNGLLPILYFSDCEHFVLVNGILGNNVSYADPADGKMHLKKIEELIEKGAIMNYFLFSCELELIDGKFFI